MSLERVTPDADALPRRAAAYLASHHVMTLATHGAGGAWAAALFYANEDFRLYFLSSPASRHCANIALDPRVAVTVQEDYADWSAIQGIQMEGVAAELSGEERAHAQRLYAARVPLLARLAEAPAAILEAFARVHLYRIEPRRIWFIDNSAGFGHRDEVDLPPGR